MVNKKRSSSTRTSGDKAIIDTDTIWTRSEFAKPGLLEKILEEDNLALALDTVRSAGAKSGPDGVQLDEALAYFEDHIDEIVDTVKRGAYTAAPVQREEVEGHDGSMRVIGIPNIQDRILQQAFRQELSPIYEQRSLKGTLAKGREETVRTAHRYLDLGFKYAAKLYLSREMDSAQRKQFASAVRDTVDDERVVLVIKEFIKSGIMAEGVVAEPALSPKGVSPISLLLANIYLDALDKEMGRREVPLVRYADEILVFAPSERAAQVAQTAACQFLKDKMKVGVKGKRTDILPTAHITSEP